MLQGGQGRADGLDAGFVNGCQRDAFVFRLHGDDVAPRVNNHAVPEGAPSVFVGAGLRGGDNVALVFHGAGAQQQLPMGFACGVGKRGGQHDEVGGGLGAEELGEAQVVADALGDTPAVDFKLGDGFACQQGVAFAIALAGGLVVEQVDFVVARQAFAAGAVNEQAVAGFVGRGAGEGDGAAEQVDLVLLRGLGERGLQDACAVGFGVGEFVAVAQPHNRPVFGQQHPVCACGGSLGDKFLHGDDVVGEAGRAGELDGGDGECGHNGLLGGLWQPENGDALQFRLRRSL